VAALPGAELKAPPMAPLALGVIVAGLLWLCLWRRRWRLFGVPAIGIGLTLVPLLVDRPDVLIAPEGKAVAARDATGVLRVSGSRAGSYAIDQFFDKEVMSAPSGPALRKGVRCDPAGCLLAAADGVRVAHVRDASAFAEDCRRADIVVTPLEAPVDCRAPLVIDAETLKRFGAQLVHVRRGEGAPRFEVTHARSATPRPWDGGAAGE
jgi:competence protein ComEC